MKLAIFDLGKVLIQFDLQKAFKSWAENSGSSFESIKNTFTLDDYYSKYERNEVSTRDYFNHLGRLLEIDLSLENWVKGWNMIWEEVNEGTYELIMKMKKDMPVVCLSNTNQSHFEIWTELYKHRLDGFEKIYASSSIGMRKPEKRVFEHIRKEYGVPYHETVFFDDLSENINSAIELGINGVLVENKNSVTDWGKQNGFL
jgi:putative hydrolase of the HAD superfamily